MPAAYQHLRVRLRIEQTRLLNWGQKVGLVEELLDQPSQFLQLNRNLIIDILLEIQCLFRGCVRITKNYDQIVPVRSNSTIESQQKFERRFPRGTNTFLIKTLSILEKLPRASKRLQWAMVKQDEFRVLIEKLIGYNNSIEALLDTAAIDQLQAMQHHTHLVMLQLSSKVDELKEISMAMQIETRLPISRGLLSFSDTPTRTSGQVDEHASIVRLANFKMHQSLLEEQSSGTTLEAINWKDITLETSNSVRDEARYGEKKVWIEWKRHDFKPNDDSQWHQVVEDRVRKLATLLSRPDKPEEFRAPLCLGYIKEQKSEHGRYGFVYEKPLNVPTTTQPTSLLDLIRTVAKPSLTKRIALAHAITRSLMYLHSVNWLHKGIRSSNIVFFTTPGETPTYSEPIISGFDYARPDAADEQTEKTPQHSEHDMYRHPFALGSSSSRSKKSWDIYSVGIVLVEIAHWKGIDAIVSMPSDHKAARAAVKRIREVLLQDPQLDSIESSVGEIYRDVVRRCLTGEAEIGSYKNADESDAAVGAEMQRVYAETVVERLGVMKL